MAPAVLPSALTAASFGLHTTVSGLSALPVVTAGVETAASLHPVLGAIDLHWLEESVRGARGALGLFVIGIYSFLIAFVLPLPSEVVLVPALDDTIGLGLPSWLELVLVMLVSGFGKAAGSVFAFHIGQEAKHAGPVVRFVERRGIPVREWSERQTVKISRKFGYAGLALALSVPFFPDTFSIYAFAVLERDYAKFALATFVGSIGRLLVTLGIIGGVSLAL